MSVMDRWSRVSAWTRAIGQIAVPIACSAITIGLIKVALSRELVGQRATLALARLGLWGPLLFVAILAIRPALLLPGQAFAALAGGLWGGAEGAALTFAGSAVAMAWVTTLGRRFVRRPIERWAGKQSAELSRLAARRDFLYATLATLNPFLPTDVCIALGAGAGGRRSRLVLGAVLGSIPGTLATAYLGGAVAKDQPAIIAVSLAGMVASLVGGALLARSIWRVLTPKQSTPSVPIPDPAEVPKWPVPQPEPADA